MRRWLVLAAALFATGAAFAQPAPKPGQAVAVFAAGCFWCAEADFEKMPGVIAVTSGYTGGTEADATYEKVSAGTTEHYEAIQVVFDPAKVGYGQLLDTFWRNHDPFDAAGQFCDKGGQYRAAIFALNDEQRIAAEASKAKAVAVLKQPVATGILRAQAFYPAEEYHQDYAKKNPLKYKFYRTTCGRDARLQAVWGAAGS